MSLHLQQMNTTHTLLLMGRLGGESNKILTPQMSLSAEGHTALGLGWVTFNSTALNMQAVSHLY